MVQKYGAETKGLDPMQLEQMRMDMQQRVRTHYQSRMVAVTIPFFQAVFTGLLAGLLVGGMIWYFGGQPKYILAGFFFTFLVVTGITWFLLLRNWNSLVWNVETALGIDLTGDGVIGKAVVPPKTIRAEVSRDNGGSNNKRYVEFPSDNARLAGFFRAILSGADLGENRWTPRQSGGFSKNEYWTTVQELLNAGVLRWKDEMAHSQGLEKTAEADPILEQWLGELGETSPPLWN